MNLSEAEREELTAMQRSRTMAVGQVRRARLILLLDHTRRSAVEVYGALSVRVETKIKKIICKVRYVRVVYFTWIL